MRASEITIGANKMALQTDSHMVKENFADGKNPQDKGDSKRHGVPTKASVSTLRKVAKQGGRKGQLAHWMANMKSGKNKTNEAETDTPNPVNAPAMAPAVNAVQASPGAAEAGKPNAPVQASNPTQPVTEAPGSATAK